MSEPQNIYVPISDDSALPIFIGCQQNPIQGAWDVCLMVGNFTSRGAALKFSDQLAEFMRGYESVRLDKAQ